MVILISQEDLTVTGSQHETKRHELHSKYSLYSLLIFFIGVCVLNVNYLFVESSCADYWEACKKSNYDYYLNNIVRIIFTICCIVFAIVQTIFCVVMKRKSVSRSPCVWFLVAVVQAANVALWFDAIIIESFHRASDHHHSLSAYFSFCDIISKDGTKYSCSNTHKGIARWFVASAPILFPNIIEFNLIVSEHFFHFIGVFGEEKTGPPTPSFVSSMVGWVWDSFIAIFGGNHDDERDPLLQNNERENRSIKSTLIILICHYQCRLSSACYFAVQYMYLHG